ncbi:hypothetical protein CTI12_AA469070 [Artemisia annua]|uniref:Zinc knuckle CX2CX4HX4C n=2 Tax=Artemisia annua TaxID=35608 RepID=A0A2U1LP16_ARTAN|nr:hypothetical protein CTI12_AA469070 [Artemisia annua]
MDRTTTSICEKPYGRASFARVLVEIDSNKPLVDTVELWYESLGKILKLWVEYAWVPPRCEECKVFGHYLSDCSRKVNTVSSVNKNGETVKTADLKKGNNGNAVNNVDDDEGWQTATGRRNGKGVGNNVGQANFGGYNFRRNVSNYNRGSYTNKTYSNAGNVGTKNVNNNTNAGNGGTRDANKKSEPVSSVNGGTVGKLDETVVANEDGKSNNKNKGISNDGAVGKNGNRNTGNGDLKKNTVNNRSGSKNDIGVSKGNETNKGNDAAVGTNGNCNIGNNESKKNTMENNSGNKSGRVSSNGNKNDKGSKSGDVVNFKVSLGATEVATSNRFDLLREEGVNEGVDLWKEVKEQVVSACNTGVPIAENILKGWNTDMVKFYTVKWNSRTKHGSSIKQQLENEMNSLSRQIVQLNRNLAMNSKLNAEKMLKHSVLTTPINSDEGNPSKRELGESSASLPKILPVTGEPIHHTIPLLATRIARHEDRLNDIVNVINGLPCGHITEDVNNLIIGQMAVESKVEQIKTEFSESMEFIAALCSANVTMGDVLTSFDHELEQISAQNFSLRRAIQESYARERTRDRTIETLTTKITELQRRMDEVSGKP